MTIPTAATIILPSDSSNTGKSVRTQTRVVSGNTVYEHFTIGIRQPNITGIYFCPYTGTFLASAHAFGTSGFFWLINPSGSTINVQIRRISMQTNIATSLSTPTLPLLTFTRFSFTGTASGSTQTPAQRATSDLSPQGSFRTAITGMSLTTQQPICDFMPPATVGTAGWAAVSPSQAELMLIDPDGFIVLVPEEGICCWQSVAGTTSDTRQFIVNVAWEEVYNQ